MRVGLLLTSALIVLAGLGASNLGACVRRETPPPAAAPEEAARKPPTIIASTSPSMSPSAEPTVSTPDDLAVAWFDTETRRTRFLCDSTAGWVRRFDTPCLAESTVWVIDRSGAEEQRVEHSGRQTYLGAKNESEQARAEVFLVSRRPPAKGARIVSANTTVGPTLTASLHEQAVAELARHEGLHGLQVSEAPMIAGQQVVGAFGAGIDTLVVLEFTGDNDWDLLGGEIVVGLAGGELVGVFGDRDLLGWAGHELIGLTDLDADGHSEALWWAASEAGIGVHITYVEDERLRYETLLACQCGGAFRAAYPRRSGGKSP